MAEEGTQFIGIRRDRPVLQGLTSSLRVSAPLTSFRTLSATSRCSGFRASFEAKRRAISSRMDPAAARAPRLRKIGEKSLEDLEDFLLPLREPGFLHPVEEGRQHVTPKVPVHLDPDLLLDLLHFQGIEGIEGGIEIVGTDLAGSRFRSTTFIPGFLLPHAFQAFQLFLDDPVEATRETLPSRGEAQDRPPEGPRTCR